MTREEMYKMLERKHKETNWKDLNSIKRYNRYVRELRNKLDG